MPRPDAWICTGKDCRKATSPLKKLRAALSDHRVEEVRCQKICKGPVVGVRIKGEVQWFRKLRGESLRKAVVRAVRTGRLAKELADQRVKKRAGKVR